MQRDNQAITDRRGRVSTKTRRTTCRHLAPAPHFGSQETNTWYVCEMLMYMVIHAHNGIYTRGGIDARIYAHV